MKTFTIFVQLLIKDEDVLESQPSTLQTEFTKRVCVTILNFEGIRTFNGRDDQRSEEGTGEDAKHARGDSLARGVHARRRRA